MSGRIADEPPRDPYGPRPIDLPTPVPLDPGADLAHLDEAKILAAPDDPSDWPAWRGALRRWRSEARARIGYDGRRYAETPWASRVWNVAMVWLWDDALYDWRAGRFDVDRLLAAYESFGGLDAVVLWHAYPVIGIDRRNQFDWYRDVPGLAELVDDLHRRDLRVFVDYNPWDVGTRRPAGSDAHELADLVTDIGADGVFLDTLKEGDPELLKRLTDLDPPPVLEGESRVPLTQIADHQASWAQWFADSDVPGVLRARWFEQRHMMHHTRRWNRDHTDELQSAWINGAGVLIWDTVFGVHVPWTEHNLTTLRSMRSVQRQYADLLIHGDWEPLTDLAPQATTSGVYASKWTHAGTTLWTVINRTNQYYTGPLLSAPLDQPLIDPTTAQILGSGQIEVPARGIGAVAQVGTSRGTAEDRERRWMGLAASRGTSEAGWTERSSAVPRRRNIAPAHGDPVPDAIVIPAGPRTLTYSYRQRETGMYETAPYIDDWKPLPPRLHAIRHEERTVTLTSVAVDAAEVTNADFAAFVDATGYVPRVANRFLAHWVDGRPAPGTEAEPVTYVDLDEARAYAAWRGARLPTEDEWQVAADDPGWRRREPLVWSWTESEHRDGRTRWAVLKGGSWWSAEGSDWYVDGGPRDPEWSVRLLLTGGGLARSECIGFRCTVDLTGFCAHTHHAGDAWRCVGAQNRGGGA
jgi:sulfatase modifying factor 1